MRGPRPKPRAELLQRGSRRARAQAHDLELPPSVPTAPRTLDREAKAEWTRIVPELEKRGVLAAVDRAGLVILCESWSEYVALSRALKSEPMGTMGWRRVFSSRQETFSRWLQLASRFGLTPTDRPRVKMNDAPSPENAPGKGRFFNPRIARD